MIELKGEWVNYGGKKDKYIQFPQEERDCIVHFLGEVGKTQILKYTQFK